MDQEAGREDAGGGRRGPEEMMSAWAVRWHGGPVYLRSIRVGEGNSEALLEVRPIP